METCLPDQWAEQFKRLVDSFCDHQDKLSKRFPEIYDRQLSKPEWTQRFLEYISGTELKPK